MSQIKFLVRVSCLTFNHAAYIEDALNGFAVQQTIFPFVCVIVDDASTDGEADVILKYLNNHFELRDNILSRDEETDDYHLIFARHKSNQNCYFAVYFLKYNHYSINKLKFPYYKEFLDTKYVAICEGDDYWIAPNKLQKQVDYLDNHENCGLLYTRFRAINIKKQIVSNIPFYKYDQNIKNLVIDAPFLAPCTWMIRKDDRTNNHPSFIVGDFPLVIEYAKFYTVDYLEDVAAVYRILPHSASHTTDNRERLSFRKGMLEIKKYYCEKLSMPKEVFEECTIKSHRLSLLDSIKVQDIIYLAEIIPYLCKHFGRLKFVEKVLLIYGYFLIKVKK